MCKDTYIKLSLISLLAVGCSGKDTSKVVAPPRVSQLEAHSSPKEMEAPKVNDYQSQLMTEQYKLIGVMKSENPKQSKALIQVNNEKPQIYGENVDIDLAVRLIKIEASSVLLSLKRNPSDVKIVYMQAEVKKEYPPESATKTPTQAELDNYSKATYIEDAFRESFLKYKKTELATP